jgi:HEAT repeat protein
MLAADLGLIERWREQYRSMRLSKRREAIGWMGRLVHDEAIPVLLRALSDPDDEIKLEAARSLIRSSGEREIAEVFRTAVRESLLIRAVLTEALRAHAAMLCRNVLPGELASPTAKHVRTALEIVRAWGKMLPLPAPVPLLRHEDSGVRVAALAILPQYGEAAAFGPEIVRLLGDADERVRAAAAQTAGRLHLGSAAEALHTCLLADGADAVVAAAYALAQIGETGWRMLEKEVLGPRRASAAAALEALEQLKSERLLLVAL